MTRAGALTVGAALALAGCALPSALAPQLGGSVGTPQDGIQTDAQELPARGTGFQRYRPWSSKYWAQPRLIRALQDAATEVVRRHPGTPPLVLGDFSARHGGKIPHHHSHRSGRDADLLFYVTTPEGAPVPSPGFVHFEADGLAWDRRGRRYLRLDVERTWTLVEALMRSPHADVQWMFCSREVEALLIEHALAHVEDRELLWRAETVLLQPSDSANHDDHIHLRVACRPEEALRGCEGGGPRWPWLPPLPRLDDRTFESVLRAEATDPPEPGARLEMPR